MTAADEMGFSTRINRRMPPVVALTSAAVALALQWLGPEAWQYDSFAQRCQFEWWRLWTGHFVHWDAAQLAWDLGAFVVLATLCERRNRRALLLTILIAPLLISLSLHDLARDISAYRGLSGLDATLFAFLATTFALRRDPGVTLRQRALSAAALALLAAKCAYELRTGRTLFTPAATWTVVPLAHLSGLIFGVAIASAELLATRLRGPHPRSPGRAKSRPADMLRRATGTAAALSLVAVIFIWGRSYAVQDSLSHFPRNTLGWEVSIGYGTLDFAHTIPFNCQPGRSWFTSPAESTLRVLGWTSWNPADWFWWRMRAYPDIFYLHFPILTLAAPSLAVILVCGWISPRAKAAHPQWCSACDYDLRGTPGRCPECGAGYAVPLCPAENKSSELPAARWAPLQLATRYSLL